MRHIRRTWKNFVASLIVSVGTSTSGAYSQTDRVMELITELKHDDPLVARSAAWKLGEHNDPRAVEPLIQFALNPPSPYPVWEIVTEALEKIHDTTGLIAALKDTDQEQRRLLAVVVLERKALSRKDNRAAEALIAAMQSKDLEVVKIGYRFFIARGVAGSEPILIEMLKQHGHVGMANDFLHSGNSRLANAASEWAKGRDNIIMMPSLGGYSGPHWKSR